MEKHSVQAGRPKGARTFDPLLASAFGAVIRSTRLEKGIAQEALAGLAGIERSHVGKIERGTHVPTLAAVFKLAKALGTEASDLLRGTEILLRAPPPG